MSATVSKLDTGTWYQAACSGMWYQTRGAAGSIMCVAVNGKRESCPTCECGEPMWLDGDLWQCGQEHCRNYNPCLLLRA